MSQTIIKIENVTKLFYPPLSFHDLLVLRLKRKPPVQALDNISFMLKEEKILGVLGPNGAGKTTLLKIISTLILPDKGRVTVNEYLVGKDDYNIKSLIGLVTSEERSFYWRLSGLQNLELFASLYGLDKKNARSRIKQLLELFKIDYQNKRFDSYSTGMKRKFALIRSLLHDPKILLFDELTKSLDYGSSEGLKRFVKDLARNGKTVIFATHNIQEAEDICDLFMIMHKGRICGPGTKEELTAKIDAGQASLTEIYQKLTDDA